MSTWDQSNPAPIHVSIALISSEPGVGGRRWICISNQNKNDLRGNWYLGVWVQNELRKLLGWHRLCELLISASFSLWKPKYRAAVDWVQLHYFQYSHHQILDKTWLRNTTPAWISVNDQDYWDYSERDYLHQTDRTEIFQNYQIEMHFNAALTIFNDLKWIINFITF